ncbi:MAG: HD domain-containing protein [Microscillaceae bacterium]
MAPLNKKKIINDPVHGFIKIPNERMYDLIQHPHFQRLRRIRQLGLAEYVYPGALHTRFHHALGAMHLMGLALTTLRQKGFEISEAEMEAAQIAILLHDVGHGPLSHALEFILLKDIRHERLSQLIMQGLNQEFGGGLSMAIDIFTDVYPRRFLHQLVSSQLDMDRLDYLLRDSFFTGVMEGTIGADRIIKMLSLHKDELVIEEKGIYSVENFLTARRLMYWQVYLHKTNLSAEQMVIQILRRAAHLLRKGKAIEMSAPFRFLLEEAPDWADFKQNPDFLKAYLSLDDYDIWAGLKAWARHTDPILSLLSQFLLQRKLFKLSLTKEKPDEALIKMQRDRLVSQLKLKPKQANYFLVTGSTSNEAYLAKGEKINILTKNGQVRDIAQASDLPNIKALRKLVKKYFVGWMA